MKVTFGQKQSIAENLMWEKFVWSMNPRINPPCSPRECGIYGVNSRVGESLHSERFVFPAQSVQRGVKRLSLHWSIVTMDVMILTNEREKRTPWVNSTPFIIGERKVTFLLKRKHGGECWVFEVFIRNLRSSIATEVIFPQKKCLKTSLKALKLNWWVFSASD